MHDEDDHAIKVSLFICAPVSGNRLCRADACKLAETGMSAAQDAVNVMNRASYSLLLSISISGERKKVKLNAEASAVPPIFSQARR